MLRCVCTTIGILMSLWYPGKADYFNVRELLGYSQIRPTHMLFKTFDVPDALNPELTTDPGFFLNGKQFSLSLSKSALNFGGR